MKGKLIFTLSDGTKVQSSKILIDSLNATTLSKGIIGVSVSFLFSDMKAVKALIEDMQR